MAVGFIVSLGASSTGTASTISGIGGAVGDIYIAGYNVTGATTISLISGSTWTQLGTTQTWAGGTRTSAVFYKVLTGTNDNTTVQFGSSVPYSNVRAVYRGVDGTSPINDFNFNIDSDASSTSIPASSLSTTSASRVALFYLSVAQGITPPSGFIERVESSSNGNISLNDIGPDYAAGSIGGWTSTIGVAAQHAAWSIALKEDPARLEPAWEASSTGGGSGSQITPLTPASVQNGDLVTYEIVLSSLTSTMTSVPSGWTLIKETQSGQCHVYTYRKIYNGTMGTFFWSALEQFRHATSRFTSPNPSTPIGTIADNSGTAGTTVTFPALTPAQDGLLLYVGAGASTVAQTNSATTPTGATERWDNAASVAGASSHLFGGSDGLASSGVATSTFTSTLTNSEDWAAQTIVLASLPLPPAAPTGLTAVVTQS